MTVRRPDVQSVEVAEYPAAQEYRPGDTYMSAGLVLKVTYVDGESELFYTGYTVEADVLQEGENIITVSYGGKSTTYKVIVGNSNQPAPEKDSPVVAIGRVCGGGSRRDRRRCGYRPYPEKEKGEGGQRQLRRGFSGRLRSGSSGIIAKDTLKNPAADSAPVPERGGECSCGRECTAPERGGEPLHSGAPCGKKISGISFGNTKKP